VLLSGLLNVIFFIMCISASTSFSVKRSIYRLSCSLRGVAFGATAKFAFLITNSAGILKALAIAIQAFGPGLLRPVSIELIVLCAIFPRLASSLWLQPRLFSSSYNQFVKFIT
jgi:hypothetical protein